MAKNITKAKAEATLKALKNMYKSYIEAGYEPKLFEPGFHSDVWTIGWEEGPYGWAINGFNEHFDEEIYALAMDERVSTERARKLATRAAGQCPKGVHVEAQNHWCLALYPDS